MRKSERIEHASTRVLNKRFDINNEEGVYIGRPSKWGNPFLIGKDGTREEVIEKFKTYAKKKGLHKLAKTELRGKVLWCWCSPLPCHGHVLAAWADGYEPKSYVKEENG